MVPYAEEGKLKELSAIEDSISGHQGSVLCIDGQVVDGMYCCYNSADVDEDIEIDIEQKAFFVGVPINEIVSITVLD